MKKLHLTLFLILLLTVLFITLNEVKSSNEVMNQPAFEYKNNFSKYVEHVPIIINSNDDFISYGFPGNGSLENPYIIQNYNITTNAEYGIRICCIDKKYTIKDCNINLEYNTTSYAIYLKDSPEYCSILNNTCQNCYFGIYLDHCSTMMIANNTLNNNTKGFYVFNSYQLTIIQNLCSYNEFLGFDFYDCVWIAITHNFFSFNMQDALKLHYTQHCLLILNTFLENSGYAVILSSNTDSVEIYQNNFTENAKLFDAQAYDSGTNNLWYNQDTLSGNFWSDLGEFCFYYLDGTAGSYDAYPLNSETNCFTNIPSSLSTIPTSQTSLSFCIITLTLVMLLPKKQLKNKEK